MPLKDILHRHGKDQRPDSRDSNNNPPTSSQEFTFIRTDTHSQEILTPNTINTAIANSTTAKQDATESPTTPRRKSFFRRHSPVSSSSDISSPPRGSSEKGEHRISNLLHLDHHSRSSLPRSGSTSSVNIPADLPQIDPNVVTDEQEREAQWEKRATRLVQGNPRLGGGASPDRLAGQSASATTNFSYLQPGLRSRGNSGVPAPQADVSIHVLETCVGAFTDYLQINIQEAIRLHENGGMWRLTY